MPTTIDPPDFGTRIARAVVTKVVPAIAAEVVGPRAIKLEQDIRSRWPVDSGASRDGSRVTVDRRSTVVRLVYTNTEDYTPHIRSHKNNLGGGSPLEILVVGAFDELDKELRSEALKRLIARQFKGALRGR